MKFIQFIGVDKSFKGKKVLRGLSLDIEKGETLTVFGGSGEGKTVLLKILLRLIPLDGGRILFKGKDVLSMNEDDLLQFRRRVAMVFQGGALFDSLTVKENVAYPLREQFNPSEQEISKIVAQKIALVGLTPDVSDALPADLSGGMKKRVALARAIATDPEVILYDEPTTGLDPINTQRVNRLIMDLQKKLNVTSVVVTHNMESAFDISDRVAFLYQGRIECAGTPEAIRQSSNTQVRQFISGGG